MSEENSPLRIILIIIVAIIIPVVVVGGYVLVNRERTPYTGQIVSVNVYPIHRDLSQATTTEGIGGQNETYDEILVLADVRIQNVAKIPLFIHDMWAVANLPDETDRSSAASTSDFEKVFIAYPDTKQYQKEPLLRDTTLQPGQSVEGQMVFHYQMTQAQWNSRNSMDIDIGFLHQNPLVMNVPKS
jgi:hypothetical protein